MTELKHFITTELTEDDIKNLFTGLDNPEVHFKVRAYWANCYTVAQEIAKRTEVDRYKPKSEDEQGWQSVIGDLGEVFLEGAASSYPSDFDIEPGSFELAKTNQKGFDGTGKHKSNKTESQVWFQMKFYNPDYLFGEKKNKKGAWDANAGREMDSFLTSTIIDGQVWRRNNRVLVTTARGLHYELNERSYLSWFRSICLTDLDNIIDDGQNITSKFWFAFRQDLIQARGKKNPLPAIVLRQDQKEDVSKLVELLTKDGKATFIAPPGYGKTEVALEALTAIEAATPPVPPASPVPPVPSTIDTVLEITDRITKERRLQHLEKELKDEDKSL